MLLLHALVSVSVLGYIPDGDPYSRLRGPIEHRGKLAELCNDLGLTGNAAEIGVYRGHFAKHNLRTGHFSKYYAIDSWAYRANDTAITKINKVVTNPPDAARNERNYQTTLESLREFLPPRGDRAVVMRRYAETVPPEFPDGFFDFIYVDGAHDFDSVVRDLELWWPKLKRGGMFAGDDFADFHDAYPTVKYHQQDVWGVKTAVHNFCKRHGLPLLLTYADLPRHLTGTGAEFDDLAFKAKGHPELLRSNRFYPAWYVFKR